MIKNNNEFDVIILCGGKGERLRPFTKVTPKPLTLIKKKPFLQYLIEFFQKNNFSNIIIACGYKSYLFKKLIKEKYKNNKNIFIVDSGDADILKRIKDCKNYVNNDFFVCYGDAFATLNLTKYINFFKKNKKNNFSTIVTSFYNLQFGTLTINSKSNKVLRFNEKPKIKEPINIGYFIFKNNIFKSINQFKTWIEFLKYLTRKRILKFYNFNGLHLTFNNYGELQIAKTKMNEIENFLKTKII
jgi:NDP-sugar pyrophosphorylase family protein